MKTPRLIVSCACGKVEFEALGRPIAAAICYCDDCQAAAARIEKMPGNPIIREPDGGTSLIVFRKDRVRCVAGEASLTKLKLRENSTTNRRIATCCNSAMILDFDDGKHWVDIYSARIKEGAPTPRMLVCAKFAERPPTNARGLPVYRGYPPRLLIGLLKARVAMLFAR